MSSVHQVPRLPEAINSFYHRTLKICNACGRKVMNGTEKKALNHLRAYAKLTKIEYLIISVVREILMGKQRRNLATTMIHGRIQYIQFRKF